MLNNTPRIYNDNLDDNFTIRRVVAIDISDYWLNCGMATKMVKQWAPILLSSDGTLHRYSSSFESTNAQIC
jgi:hypothetical protein